MERSSQESAIGMPNSVSYNPPQLNQESQVKLPLASIISSPPDRRGNAKTLNKHQHQDQDQHQLNSPPPQPSLVQKDSISDPDPDPYPARVASGTTGGASNLRIDPPPQPHDLPATSSNPTDTIRYNECLKNHAASVGGHVLDGCGEFTPSGEEGTPEALRCAACDCHRSFHRREADGESQTGTSHYYTYNPNSSNNNIHRNPLFPRQNQYFTATPPSGRTPPTVVAFGRNSGGGAGAESASEDLNMFRSNARGHEVVQPSFSRSKKRFRTKFSQEQKDRMHEFATRLGWKIQKEDEQELQQFCNEMGVKRRVFKVWMHNNKQAMKKRQMYYVSPETNPI
ncbi:zinc-finger homeodomain 6-like [Olea europaea subsp. europaea]|uniref:Zinc-finger homeodomain 6-like n=1 Tax=Olea europaea subsp. europaea TaxID=158383 RepID=A0A8S0RP73_OLEEU|nr:zinc-finger homeodomain 6-like [Olea europaea subsp. europaea]